MLLAACFASLLAAPLIDALVRDAAFRDTRPEGRAPSPRPQWPHSASELAAFPAAFDAHHSDTLGLRDCFLRWRSFIHWFCLDRSPTPIVVKGTAGWIYTSVDSSREVARGTLPMSQEELARLVSGIERRRAWCASRGARYVLAIAPNKESIYPEHLPSSWERANANLPTRLDQLAHAMHGKAEFLDLRPALLAAKHEDTPGNELYTQLGTHWNGRGTLAAVDALLSRLAPSWSASDPGWRQQIRRGIADGNGDTWGSRLYIDDLLPQLDWTPFMSDGRASTSILAVGVPGRMVHSSIDDSESGPRLIVFHDSFGPYAMPLLSRCMTSSLWVQRPTPDPALIESYKPDTVLDLHVERALLYTDLFDAPELAGTPPEVPGETIWAATEPQGAVCEASGLDPADAGSLSLDCMGVASGDLIVQVYTRPCGGEFRRADRKAFVATGSFKHVLELRTSSPVDLRIVWTTSGSARMERLEVRRP